MEAMKARQLQGGLSLLVLAILLALSGFALAQFNAAGQYRQKLNLEQLARQNQVLDHIRAGLFGFTAQQGVHSQSHLGHLPCPATQANSIAQTTCLQKPWGYLPVRSKTATNYLNVGIDARTNELELSTHRDWHYAVSPQLIQPNDLGWSRWVDFSKPGVQVRIPSENNRTELDIVAVVAHTIVPLAEHQYEITPPYFLVREHELREHMTRIQTHLLKDTLKSWIPHNRDAENFTLQDAENLETLSANPGTFKPVNSNCNCRCTKTRCTCSCDSTGQWRLERDGTNCTSTADEPCVLYGPASMRSGWPVSRFEPVAAANKSCRPSQRNQCPLSTSSEACVCDFSWPDNTKANLDQFRISQSDAGLIQVHRMETQQ